MPVVLPPGVTLRPASPADLDGIIGVHAVSREAAYRAHLPAGLLARDSLQVRRGRWRERLGGADPTAVTWVAVRDGRIVGFCHASSPSPDPAGDAAHIQSLYLDPAAQGGGIGRELLRATLGSVAALGFRRATLHVYGFNGPAITFYERLGWRRIAELTLLEWDGEPVAGFRYQTRLPEAGQG